MTNLLKLSGLVALVSLLATPWVLTPAIVSAVVFLVLYAVEYLERSKQFVAKLKIAEDAITELRQSNEKFAFLEEKVSEHNSNINSLLLKNHLR